MSVVIAAYGGGTDSTAMLIEMVNRGEPAPHAILFADTGGEHPHTYAHIWKFSEWLLGRGYPAITIIRKGGVDRTLEGDCLVYKRLPSLAYGFKGCSLKFKVEPQEKWANNDPACKAAWAAGQQVTKCVGYEWGEERRVKDDPSGKYLKRYPLIEWQMDRDACKAVILDAGLKLPGKSSCFFCPASTKSDIRALEQTYPQLLWRALHMEDNARENLGSVKGLGRRFSWRDYVEGRAQAPELPMDMPCDCYDGAAS